MIYPFAFFAVFVPVVSLHFYLVFPRSNPILAAHRRLVLTVLYGVPTAYLAALWGSMLWSRLAGQSRGGERGESALADWSSAWRWATSRWRW